MRDELIEDAADDQVVAGQGPDAGPEPIRRGYDSTVDSVSPAGVKRPWVVSTINTDGVDRFNTAILPGGIDRREYEKDRVVLWEHGKDPARGRVPIGRNLWIKPTPDRRGLLAKTEFSDDEFSRGLFELYRDGFLKAWSIFATPNGGRAVNGPPTAAEVKARPDLAAAELVYRAVILREYSGVSVPGNGDCVTSEVGRSLAAASARGLWIPDSLRATLPAPVPVATPAPAPGLPTLPPLPPLRGRTADDVERSLERRIAGVRSKLIAQAVQDARDIARGAV